MFHRDNDSYILVNHSVFSFTYAEESWFSANYLLRTLDTYVIATGILICYSVCENPLKELPYLLSYRYFYSIKVLIVINENRIYGCLKISCVLIESHW